MSRIPTVALPLTVLACGFLWADGARGQNTESRREYFTPGLVVETGGLNHHDKFSKSFNRGRQHVRPGIAGQHAALRSYRLDFLNNVFERHRRKSMPL